MVSKVAFRVDASLQMGSGHVMRCLTLADALRAAGVQCLFVCRPHAGNLVDLIRERHRCVELPATAPSAGPTVQSQDALYSSWLGCAWEADASQTCHVLEDFEPDWLIVDHYALDSRWEQVAGAGCKRMLAIDDLANRPHACNLLLDQNLGRVASDYATLVPKDCASLTGPGFALLRDEFARLRQTALTRREAGHVEHVLVSMGGADANNTTSAILQALEKSALPHACAITVVLGRQNPWRQDVEKMAAGLPFQTRVLVDSKEMATLMVDADLAIGAAGATSWERCCLGLPTLLLTLADNQIPSAKALQAAGAARYVGGAERVAFGLTEAIGSLLDGAVRQAMSLSASRVCDGLGVQRVVEHMRRSVP